MSRSLVCLGVVVAAAIGFSTPVPMAVAQEDADWGDAPEGVIAYPSLGVTGRFPTCLNVPISLFIRHGATPPLWAYFGPIEDYEGDGNAGGCPFFNPYDSDECFQDGDAGLLFPEAWTIQGGVEVPCISADTLAADCTVAVWGIDIDIDVVNNGPFTGYINIVADWNQDGRWLGSSQCPGGTAPEHVLVNFAVSPPTIAPLSTLLPAGSGFLTGPNLGYVWMRFSITEVPVPLPWDGSGVFEGGESEDYLLLIARGGGAGDDGDYGDAPEGATAYPNGIMGAFPTCRTVGPAGYVHHLPTVSPRLAFFGPTSDDEVDGNAGTCPVFAPYDLDECFQDGDAGLLFPAAYTMQAGAAIPCSAPPGSLKVCQMAAWGADIDIDLTNNLLTDAYVNVLADWTGDGQWSGSANCPTGPTPEHVLVDWPVPPGFTGALSLLTPPQFLVGPNPDYVWMRFTISEVPVGQDWNGEGVFEDGETEDYLIRTVDPFTSVESIVTIPSTFRLHESVPNPMTLATTIRFDLPVRSPVSLRIYDITGRLVRTLMKQSREEGQHRVVWNGRDDAGREVGAGVYFCRLDAGAYSATRRLVLLR